VFELAAENLTSTMVKLPIRAVERLVFLITLIARLIILTRHFDRYSSCCRLLSANDCTSCCSRLIYMMRPLSNLPSNN